MVTSGANQVNSNLPPGGSGDGLPAAKPAVPRSPRAALEPERVPMPSRRSSRARHPVIVVGNAIFTVLIVISVAVGAALAEFPLDADVPAESVSQEGVVVR